eukprot:3764917-Rhodomonas_salina.5
MEVVGSYGLHVQEKAGAMHKLPPHTRNVSRITGNVSVATINGGDFSLHGSAERGNDSRNEGFVSMNRGTGAESLKIHRKSQPKLRYCKPKKRQSANMETTPATSEAVSA